MSYSTVYNLIKAALTLRPAGTKVQVADHEAAELALLDYIEEKSGSRDAHATALANTNCNLVWSSPFTNTNYGFLVNGFDADGNPCQVTLISKTATQITVQTFTASSLYAIANPF